MIRKETYIANPSELEIQNVVYLLNLRLSQYKPFLKELHLILIKNEMKRGHSNACEFLEGLIASIDQQSHSHLFFDLKNKALELLEHYRGIHERKRIKSHAYLYKRLAYI